MASLGGRLKGERNRGVKLQGLCAAWKCSTQAVALIEAIPLCDFHLRRADEHGTVANPCQGPGCSREAVRVLSPIGYALCGSHGMQRYTLGTGGALSSVTEPELKPLDPARVAAGGERSREPLERFMDKVQGDSDTGCWVWTGAIIKGTTSDEAYGRFYVAGREPRAHIWAWENVAGLERDGGLVIDHICRNPFCVRPGHLQQVTREENSAMATTRRREPPEGYVMQPPNRTLTVQEYAIGLVYGLPAVNHESDVIYPEGWSRGE